MRRFVPLLFVSILSVTDCSQKLAKDTHVQDTSAPQLFRVPVDDLPSIGSPAALITVVAFIDYECPYCKRADASFARLRAEYGADLRMVVAQRPLPMHAHARAAARAALAAAEQKQYGAMHERLFQSPSLDDASLDRIAIDLGLDVSRFDADRVGPRVDGSLAKAEEIAQRFDVRGTPCFFVNGERVDGAWPYDELRGIIEQQLARARALVKAGTRPADVYAAAVANGADSATHARADLRDPRSCEGRNCDSEPAVREAVTRVPVDGAPSRGPAAARITVVAFDDFECSFCARAEASLHALEQAHPGDVRVVFKHRPLPMHEHARLAARAAVAAEAQGRFWEYHDALFAHQDALDRASLIRYATALGLDAERFARDLDDPRTEARVVADEADGSALKVTGTPTFFVGGHRIVGAQPLATFEAAASR